MKKLAAEQLAGRILYAGRMRTPEQIETCKRNIRAVHRRGKATRQAWRKANPDKVQEENRRGKARLLKKLGPDGFAALCRKHKGLPTPTRPEPKICEICGLPPSRRGPNNTRLHLDHDHKTGKFRGWLCDRHNRGLGYFQDNPSLLRKAVIYLEQNS